VFLFLFFWESWFFLRAFRPFSRGGNLGYLENGPFTRALAVVGLYEDSIGGGFP